MGKELTLAKLYCAEIDALVKKYTPVFGDYGLNKNKNIKEYHLPDDINEKLIELVKILGLRFASCDLVIDKDNRIYFLESNVQGNWLWTEINENMNISEAIADALIKALEMDSPELFSTRVFTDEAIKIVQDKVQADLDELSISIKKKITEIKIIKN